MLTHKLNIDQHENCNMVIIHRFFKNGIVRPGLYCENHGCLIQWLTDKKYDLIKKTGIEDLGMTQDDQDQYQRYQKLQQLKKLRK